MTLLSLNSVKVPKTTKENLVEEPINHIVLIDCSGSMSYDLPYMREQLKTKLTSLLKEQDTITIIWFSGRGEYGTLIEKCKINNLVDFENLKKAIDRWLQPIGMTGFVEPLNSIKKIIKDDGIYSLFFMTDGYDNQWESKEILKELSELKEIIVSSVFVEYGWHCNHNLLSKMAEEINGSLVFAEDFEKYEPIIEKSLMAKPLSNKRVCIKIENPLNGIVFSVSENGAISYKVENGQILVSESVPEVFYFSEDNETNLFEKNQEAIYQAVSLFSQKMESSTVRRILTQLGDVFLFNKFSNSFGKQNLLDFQQMALEASFNDSKRFTEGKSDSLKIDPNAFTILDLLFLLEDDKDNKLAINEFNYNRIGRTAEISENISEKEKAELQEMLLSAKDKNSLAEVKAKIEELENKKTNLNFKSDGEEFLSINKLTWNKTRPNVSILVKINGFVNLLENNLNLPKKFPTFIYRNFSIICDGIANVDILPIKLSKSSFEILFENKLVSGKYNENKIYEINLRNLPTINERMIQKISAKELFTDTFESMKIECSQKVYKAFKELWFGKRKSEGYLEKYGEEATAYLSSLGLSEFNGYSPKVTLSEKKDCYMGVEMVVAMDGFLSKLPSYNKFKERLDSGKKLNATESLFLKAHTDCSEMNEKFKNGEIKEKDLEEWIIDTEKKIKVRAKNIEKKITEIKFSAIVGQIWFSEFSDINENSLKMEFDGIEHLCRVEMKDIEISI